LNGTVFSGSIPPGSPAVVVTIMRTVLSSDPTPLVDNTTSLFHPDGFPNQFTPSASCPGDIQTRGCALSPRFLQGGQGSQLWDSPTDQVAAAAGFTTNTVFPWLDPSVAGKTYLQVMAMSGSDPTVKLAFKYIAARLNLAGSNFAPDLLPSPDIID